MKKELQQLQELCDIYGASGHENLVAKYLKAQYEKLGFEVTVDNLGSVIACKKSKLSDAKKVMLIAHMDEVGFMVQSIDKLGKVNVVALGGINHTLMSGLRVTLKNRTGEYLEGMIESLPPHLMLNQSAPGKVTDYKFDFGYTTKEDCEKHISIGDVIIPRGDFTLIADEQSILAKALDDRAGCSALLSVAKMKQEYPFDVYFVGSVQEEVGLRGAKVVTNRIAPDLAIVVDVSPVREEMGKRGEGVVIRHLDSNMIPFPRLMKFQSDVFNKYQIKHQDYISLGGTEAGVVHLALDGVATLTNCLLATSIHAPNGIMSVEDYLGCVKSISCLLSELDNDKIIEMKNKYES